ncbi:MAG: Rid family detoxifying hydrolase [Longimicrobiales bacterium]
MRRSGIGVAGAFLVLAGCAGGADVEEATPGKRVLVATGAVAPYSPAVLADDFVFLSGQIGIAPGRRGLVPGGIAAETRQALENVRALVQASGASLSDVAQCTVFLDDIGNYGAMNEVYLEFFPTEPPARTAVAVAGLPLGAAVEVACIVVVRQ